MYIAVLVHIRFYGRPEEPNLVPRIWIQLNNVQPRYKTDVYVRPTDDVTRVQRSGATEWNCTHLIITKKLIYIICYVFV